MDKGRARGYDEDSKGMGERQEVKGIMKGG